MEIQLPKEHEDWLREQVAAGRFSSMEEALAEAVNSLRDEDEDFDWAKPLIEEGLTELNRGEGLPADEVFARVEARLREKM
jgi:antitoxin ParD1/3/4